MVGMHIHGVTGLELRQVGSYEVPPTVSRYVHRTLVISRAGFDNFNIELYTDDEVAVRARLIGGIRIDDEVPPPGVVTAECLAGCQCESTPAAAGADVHAMSEDGSP